MKDFALNTLALTLARGLLLGGRAVVLLVLAWTATPAQLAAAAIAVTLAETARLTFDFGIEVWLVRAIAGTPSPSRQRQHAFEGLAVRVAGALSGAVLVVVGALLFLALDARLAVAAGLLTLTGLVSGVPVAVMQARLQLHQLVLSVIPLLTAGLVVIGWCAHGGAGTVTLLVLLAISEGVATLCALAQAGLLPGQVLRLPPGAFMALARACAPIALFNGIVGVYSRLDLWALAFLAPAAVATYTVAYRLYQPGSLLVASIAGVAYAAFARSLIAGSRGRPSRSSMLRVIVVLLALAAGFLVVGRWITAQLFSRYAGADALVLMFAALLPIVGINGMCTALLSAHGRFATLCRLAAFNLVVFTVALLALVPQNGARGAAGALLIGESCNLCVQSWLVLRMQRLQRQSA